MVRGDCVVDPDRSLAVVQVTQPMCFTLVKWYNKTSPGIILHYISLNYHTICKCNILFTYLQTYEV
jgi:hypothetical protein